MDEYLGRTVIIGVVTDRDTYRMEHIGYSWTDEMLEPVEDKPTVSPDGILASLATDLITLGENIAQRTELRKTQIKVEAELEACDSIIEDLVKKHQLNIKL